MKRLLTILLLALFACIPSGMKAVVAYPYPIEFKQPNGETIIIRMCGDEYFHYATTEDGSVIAFDQQSGYYAYAVIDNGQLLPGAVKVSNNRLRDYQVSQRLKSDSMEFLEQVKQPVLARALERKNSLRSSQQRATMPPTGNRKSLVILANFVNRKFVVPDPKASFEKMLTQQGYNENGATGSVRDFYTDNSNGKFAPDFQVYGPVELPQEIAFYGANTAAGGDQNVPQMIIDACLAAKAAYPELNFADYDPEKIGSVDNVSVFFAGYNEAEGSNRSPDLIWPQKSSVFSTNTIIDGVRLADYVCTSELRGNTGNLMAGIGTFTHEFGHVLGLPDLYDADGDVNGKGAGVGQWCTMGTGPYLHDGKTPPYFGAIERHILGWMKDPVVIDPVNSSGKKELSPLSNSGDNVVFKLNTSTPEEYFLFEVRKKQRGTWDEYLPGEGMLVFHVDRTTTANKTVSINGRTETLSALNLWENYLIPNIIGNHQCYDLLRANNNPSHELGNPFPGTDATVIADFTLPGLLAWNGQRSNALISNITRDAVTGNVSFDLYAATTEVITHPTTDISHTSACLNGTVTEPGMIEKGFCWNTTGGYPDIEHDQKITVSSTGTGAYRATIAVSSYTQYYVRAYAKASDGQIYYGGRELFHTPASIPFNETFMTDNQKFWTFLNGNDDGAVWTFHPKGEIGWDRNVSIVTVEADTEGDYWMLTPPIAVPENSKNLKFSLEVVVFNDAIINVGVFDTDTKPNSFDDLWESSLKDKNDMNQSKLNVYTLSDTIDKTGGRYAGKTIYMAVGNVSKASTNGSRMWVANFKITADGQGGSGIDNLNPDITLPLVYVQDKTVYFRGVLNNSEAEIFDVTGKLHYKIPISDGSSQYIHEPGIYLVKIRNNRNIQSYKLIVH